MDTSQRKLAKAQSDLTKSQQELSKLKALYSDPDRAPLTHVRGPRMGQEILKRLETSTKAARGNSKLQAQISAIRAAIQLGHALINGPGSLECW